MQKTGHSAVSPKVMRGKVVRLIARRSRKIEDELYAEHLSKQHANSSYLF